MTTDPQLPTPKSVMWFANGMAMVFDEAGEQIPEYQGRHIATYRTLQGAGYDPLALTTFGSPQCLFDGSIACLPPTS